MKTLELDRRCGTPEGSCEFDRFMDARLSLREKIQWLEDMETLRKRFEQARIKRLREGNEGRAADS
jgi:hypothetical protein